ncbi:MAG: hypothetical protein KKA07_08870 [Bacteroidetes bacterium]|nr:hypothetical protein [Bacteroidota bacterium]MBU1719173.1 hypothetical protein [Bacteroidota bacterium]
MKKALFLFAAMGILFSGYAQFPAGVTKIDSKPNATVSIKGNLSKGSKMTDLSWASTSSNACWPATQNTKFNGNHVLFSTNLPKRAKMYITVIPDDKNANMSIYAYSMGTTNYTTPPALTTCVSCEAEHKWDYPKKGKTQDHTREVYLNAINNPYNVVIGIAGADGLATGGFTIEVKIEGGEEAALGAQATVKVSTITAVAGKSVEVKGNLSSGVKINDLSWAWSSSVACFPETQKKKFTGNHVLYKTELPTRSIMEITVIPDDPNANFSIYAYSVGSGKTVVVPDLPSCVSCEAEHKWDYPKKNRTQDHTRTISLNAIGNPYTVFIGVVGADGLTSGGFKLKITLKS